MQLIGILDHLEQGAVARSAVDFPGGVEDLVAAVLGVGLGEHHQLRCRWDRGPGGEILTSSRSRPRRGPGRASGSPPRGRLGLGEHRHAGHRARASWRKRTSAAAKSRKTTGSSGRGASAEGAKRAHGERWAAPRSMVYAMTRSMRFKLRQPQSGDVGSLEDQGDMVPGRGATT